jgi:hypothetical protein
MAKATITPEIIRLIAEKYRIDDMKALDLWYNSPIAECLADDETGLWGQSPLYIFSLFEEDARERTCGA